MESLSVMKKWVGQNNQGNVKPFAGRGWRVQKGRPATG